MSVWNYIIISWGLGLMSVLLYLGVKVIRKNKVSSDIADLLYEENKRKPPVEESLVCPCDTCAKVYRYWNVGDDRKYICEKTSGFFRRSAAPAYCRNYEKRDSKPDSASTPSATQFITVLEELYPKDRIPVVRCEDCEHFFLRDDDDEYGVCTEIEYDPRRKNDFCSFGVKKEEQG